MNELSDLYFANSNPSKGSWYHKLTLSLGYRVYSSNKYFIGTKEINRPNAVKNHQNIFDVGFNYQFTPRLSVIGDIPFYSGTRNQIYPPTGIYQVGGIGDITVGVQGWVWRPPTENGGNIAFDVALSMPTGIYGARGAGLLGGQTVNAVADQSLQPGTGGWGFVAGSQAYKRIWLKTMAYFQGQWLFSPVDTNGVPTYRKQVGQGVMSVPDQYLFRAGASHNVPGLKHLALSLGVRWEGVPAHDVFGDSNGFRRPGYIVSLDPGLVYGFRNTTLTVDGPWALDRNREPSVPELENGTKNGDAFFADYTILVNLSHRF